jgi:hypothetical protein
VEPVWDASTYIAYSQAASSNTDIAHGTRYQLKAAQCSYWLLDEIQGVLKQKPERPRPSTEPIQKAPTHLLFFKLHFQALRGVQKRTSAPARKKKYVRAFFFSAFLGDFWQGEFENTKNQLSASPKNPLGKTLFWGIFLTFFSTFLLRWLSALSVRGTQKRDKKCFAGFVRLNFFPLPTFFIAFLGVSR